MAVFPSDESAMGETSSEDLLSSYQLQEIPGKKHSVILELEILAHLWSSSTYSFDSSLSTTHLIIRQLI